MMAMLALVFAYIVSSETIYLKAIVLCICIEIYGELSYFPKGFLESKYDVINNLRTFFMKKRNQNNYILVCDLIKHYLYLN